MRLKGKIALVTGSSRGIGQAIALKLAEEGADIIINFLRHRQGAEETAREVEKLGVNAQIIKANLVEPEKIDAMFETIASKFGRLDILVNNAASGVARPVLDLDTRGWEWAMDINAKAFLLCSQQAVKLMGERGGKIVSITSLGSFFVLPDYVAVGVSKAALEALTRYLAVELAPKGICVNAVAASAVLTEAIKFFIKEQEGQTPSWQMTPAGRMVTPEDVANVVAFLCSEEASMIRGQTIIVDGGTSQLPLALVKRRLTLNKQRVVITGVGAVTPLGLNVEELWEGLVAGKLGIDYIKRFNPVDSAVKVDAEVKGFDPTKYMDIKIVDRISRSTQFGITAALEAVESSKLDLTKENTERIGVITANLVETDYLVKASEMLSKRGPRHADPLFITKSSPSVIAMQIGMLTGAKGPNSSVNSLCASGSDAIGTAFNHMRLGYADVMIAGGADASLGTTTIAGMNILGALSRETDPAKACRPFDLNRSGFVMGEASGMMVLETYDHARERGAPILAELIGAGWSFDAFSTTAPHFETEAIAINVALQDAGIKPEEVDYINAHGTGTKLNDRNETRAIKAVFKDNAYRIPLSANKSMIGHTITAGGAVEAIAAVLTIKRNMIPPTIGYETPDPECDLDCVPNTARPAQVNICLCNSFGLGGENCCLVIKRFDEK